MSEREIPIGYDEFSKSRRTVQIGRNLVDKLITVITALPGYNQGLSDAYTSLDAKVKEQLGDGTFLIPQGGNLLKPQIEVTSNKIEAGLSEYLKTKKPLHNKITEWVRIVIYKADGKNYVVKITHHQRVNELSEEPLIASVDNPLIAAEKATLFLDRIVTDYNTR